MLDADRQRFVALLSGVADYYGKEFSNAVVKLYWQGLRQFDIADVERALWEHTQNPDVGQHLPKIADITRMLMGRTQDQAAVAWNKVDQAIRTIGTYVDVVFDDALIHRVITELGGWIWLGKQDDEEWPFIARRFENLYRGYRIRAEIPLYPPQLTGLANASNTMERHAAMPPLLVGDLSKALLVYRSGTTTPLLTTHRVAQMLDKQNVALLTMSAGRLPENKPDTKEAA